MTPFPFPVNQITLAFDTMHELQHSVALVDPDRFESMVTEAAYKASHEAKQFWEEEASRRLKSTRSRYIKALYIYESFGEGVVIGINTQADPLVKAIEEGAPAFDMKPGLLAGSKKRTIPVGNNPVAFRTVSTQQRGEGVFTHPGWSGLHLEKEVRHELHSKILPKHLERVLANL